MLRITKTHNDATVVRVDGRLDDSNVQELEEACQTADRELRLDLSGLRTADAAGVKAILELGARGASITGESLYIKLLIRQFGGAAQGGDRGT